MNSFTPEELKTLSEIIADRIEYEKSSIIGLNKYLHVGDSMASNHEKELKKLTIMQAKIYLQENEK